MPDGIRVRACSHNASDPGKRVRYSVPIEGVLTSVLIVIYLPGASLASVVSQASARARRLRAALVVVRGRLPLEAVVIDRRTVDDLRTVLLEPFQEQSEGVVVGDGHAELPRLTHQRAIERVDLRSLALLEVLERRRLVVLLPAVSLDRLHGI